MHELETPRLRLRLFAREDLDDLYKIYQDATVMKYLLGTRTKAQTEASLCGHIQQWQNYDFGMWAVVEKITGDLIGRCGLSFLDNTLEVELGYVFAQEYWGKGIGDRVPRNRVSMIILVVNQRFGKETRFLIAPVSLIPEKCDRSSRKYCLTSSD